MRRLNVALVAPSLDILGGQAVQADRLLRAWRDDAEVNAWLVPVNPDLPRPIRFAARIKYLRTIATELTYVPRLVQELLRADVVHVFSASYTSFLLAPLPAVIVARALGRPVLMNYRSGEAPDHLGRSAVARMTLRRAQKNVVPSPFLVEVLQRFNISASIVPNLVDLDRFQYRDRSPLAPRLLSTRNFDDLYNVGCTLRAFQRIQRHRPDASLTLVGSGPHAASLRAQARALGLTNVVFTGQIPPDRMAEYYAAHDIYIQSPNIDNAPTSVLEAFASGLPVVSTEAGGIPKILTHMEHGLLAPLDADEALASHVLALLEHPDLALRIARAARERCGASSWAPVRAEWLRHYRSLVEDTVPAPAGSERGWRRVARRNTTLPAARTTRAPIPADDRAK